MKLLLDEMYAGLKEYFETLGWDERGIPTKETLKRLDLSDLEPYMKKLRV